MYIIIKKTMHWVIKNLHSKIAFYLLKEHSFIYLYERQKEREKKREGKRRLPSPG